MVATSWPRGFERPKCTWTTMMLTDVTRKRVIKFLTGILPTQSISRFRYTDIRVIGQCQRIRRLSSEPQGCIMANPCPSCFPKRVLPFQAHVLGVDLRPQSIAQLPSKLGPESIPNMRRCHSNSRTNRCLTRRPSFVTKFFWNEEMDTSSYVLWRFVILCTLLFFFRIQKR